MRGHDYDQADEQDSLSMHNMDIIDKMNAAQLESATH